MIVGHDMCDRGAVDRCRVSRADAECTGAGVGHTSSCIGPSGVRALPLAAGINEGGHYFRY